MRLFDCAACGHCQLLAELGSGLDELGVDGLHLFTFNQLDGAVAWHLSVVGTADGEG